jgi:DNA polymerase
MKEKLKKLDVLESMWKTCHGCDLNICRKRVVTWRGSPGGRIFLIGEGPGADEDQQGIPFVGMAGRKLDDLMVEAGINVTDEVFIANMVGCRPPDNRQPKPEEIGACRPRLEAMLWIVQPKVVVLLGLTAAKLAGITAIKRWRGRQTEMELNMYNGETAKWPAIPTFHPSYLNRSGDNAEIHAQIVGDLKLAKDMAYAHKA